MYHSIVSRNCAKSLSIKSTLGNSIGLHIQADKRSRIRMLSLGHTRHDEPIRRAFDFFPQISIAAIHSIGAF